MKQTKQLMNFYRNCVFLALLLVLAACKLPERLSGARSGGSPSDNEVRSWLESQLPGHLQLKDLQFKSQQERSSEQEISFSISVAPRRDLYSEIDIDQELAVMGWKKTVKVFDSPKPRLLVPAQAQGEVVSIQGTFRATGPSPWKMGDLKWDLDRSVVGRLQETFDASSLVAGTAGANGPIHRYIRQGTFTNLPVATGEKLQKAVLDTLYPDSVLIIHAKGTTQVQFQNLPAQLQRYFYYDERQAENAVAERKRVAEREATMAARQSRPQIPQPTRRESTLPPEPPANTKDIIEAHILRYSVMKNTVSVETRSPVWDDVYWAWKVEFSYSFYYAGDRSSAGGTRVEGTAYAWFRDKQMISVDDIFPAQRSFR